MVPIRKLSVSICVWCRRAHDVESFEDTERLQHDVHNAVMQAEDMISHSKNCDLAMKEIRRIRDIPDFKYDPEVLKLLVTAASTKTREGFGLRVSGGHVRVLSIDTVGLPSTLCRLSGSYAPMSTHDYNSMLQMDARGTASPTISCEERHLSLLSGGRKVGSDPAVATASTEHLSLYWLDVDDEMRGDVAAINSAFTLVAISCKSTLLSALHPVVRCFDMSSKQEVMRVNVGEHLSGAPNSNLLLRRNSSGIRSSFNRPSAIFQQLLDANHNNRSEYGAVEVNVTAIAFASPSSVQDTIAIAVQRTNESESSSVLLICRVADGKVLGSFSVTGTVRKIAWHLCDLFITLSLSNTSLDRGVDPSSPSDWCSSPGASSPSSPTQPPLTAARPERDLFAKQITLFVDWPLVEYGSGDDLPRDSGSARSYSSRSVTRIGSYSETSFPLQQGHFDTPGKFTQNNESEVPPSASRPDMDPGEGQYAAMDIDLDTITEDGVKNSFSENADREAERHSRDDEFVAPNAVSLVDYLFGEMSAFALKQREKEVHVANHCYVPGTREKALELMRRWCEAGNNQSKRLLWIQGCAKNGKTTAVNTFCNMYPQFILGSFSCESNLSEAEYPENCALQSRRFCLCLAYQMYKRFGEAYLGKVAQSILTYSDYFFATRHGKFQRSLISRWISTFAEMNESAFMSISARIRELKGRIVARSRLQEAARVFGIGERGRSARLRSSSSSSQSFSTAQSSAAATRLNSFSSLPHVLGADNPHFGSGPGAVSWDACDAGSKVRVEAEEDGGYDQRRPGFATPSTPRKQSTVEMDMELCDKDQSARFPSQSEPMVAGGSWRSLNAESLIAIDDETELATLEYFCSVLRMVDPTVNSHNSQRYAGGSGGSFRRGGRNTISPISGGSCENTTSTLPSLSVSTKDETHPGKRSVRSTASSCPIKAQKRISSLILPVLDIIPSEHLMQTLVIEPLRSLESLLNLSQSHACCIVVDGVDQGLLHETSSKSIHNSQGNGQGHDSRGIGHRETDEFVEHGAVSRTKSHEPRTRSGQMGTGAGKVANELTQLVCLLHKHLPKWCKFIVTSKPYKILETIFCDLSPTVCSLESCSQSISSSSLDELAKILEFHLQRKKYTGILDEAVQVLLEKSEGHFSYVKYVSGYVGTGLNRTMLLRLPGPSAVYMDLLVDTFGHEYSTVNCDTPR